MIGFFTHRLEQAGSDLSVERVQEVIMKGAQALPTDRLKVDPSHTRTVYTLYGIDETVGKEKGEIRACQTENKCNV